ncbi:MAG TPA: sulfatase [Pirellulales bacterium]
MRTAAYDGLIDMSEWFVTLGCRLAAARSPAGFSVRFTAQCLAVCSIVWLVGLTAHAAERSPNILWLIGENIDLDLGCYGAQHVSTPNLDRLAREGVRWTRAFATAPVCSASRSAFMTGMYQTTIGAHNARSHRDGGHPLPPGVRTVMARLKNAGYFTANVRRVGNHTVGTGKVDLNFDVTPQLFDSDDWSALANHQPFFAQVNSPEVEYDIYDRQSARKPRVTWVGEAEHAPIAKPEAVKPPPYYPDHPIVREEWARYLNSVSGMDRRIGIVLKQLELDGLTDDTIVIFFADNGRLEPRGIHWCYDSGLHVPLIVRWPRNFPPPAGFQPGTVSEAMVSLIDVTAATLALASVPIPALMQGRNFLDPKVPARTMAFSARDRIDETVQHIRTVRTSQYRYIRNFMPEQSFTALNRYKEKCFPIMPLMRQLHAAGKLSGAPAALMAPRLPDEELYDLAADPFEIHNLATSPDEDQRRTLVNLRSAVQRWIVETADQGERLERPEVVAPFAQEMDNWFGTPAWFNRQTQ